MKSNPTVATAETSSSARCASCYRLTPAPFTAAALWMAELGAEWDVRLEELRRLLERGAVRSTRAR